MAGAQSVEEAALAETQVEKADDAPEKSQVPEKGPENVATQPATPSEAPSEAAHAVEAFSWDQLRQPKVEYCYHCKAVTSGKPTQIVKKKRHKNVACRSCHNVISLLYKRCDMKAIGWKSLSEEQQVSFFQAAGKMTTNGSLDFSKIKGRLIDSLTEAETHRQISSMRGKYLPLSVWVSRGYDGDCIAKKAESKPSDLSLTLILLIFLVGLLCLR